MKLCKTVSGVKYISKKNNNNLVTKSLSYPFMNIYVIKGKNKNLAFNFKSCISTLKYTVNCLPEKD